jgi:hypothetical protein
MDLVMIQCFVADSHIATHFIDRFNATFTIDLNNSAYKINAKFGYKKTVILNFNFLKNPEEKGVTYIEIEYRVAVENEEETRATKQNISCPIDLNSLII